MMKIVLAEFGRLQCKKTNVPEDGGEEVQYLLSFLEARTVIMRKEEAHLDLSRIEVQKKFIHDNNYELSLLLEGYELREISREGSRL